MNKKIIAIAALALVATSGLASARTIHAPKTRHVRTERTVVSSPYDAMNQYSLGAENQTYDHPGDNAMDRYNTAEMD